MTSPRDAPESAATQPRHAPQRTRRRAVKALTITLSVLVVLAAGVVILDNWARAQVADFVVTKIQQAFSLDADQPVTVSVAGFSVLGQLATGALDEVSAEVENVAVGDLRGAVSITLTDVPIDELKPVGQLRAEFRMTESSVAALITTLSAATVNSVVLAEPEIQLGSEFTTPSFTLFGVTVPSIPIVLAVGLEPYAEAGMLGFTPTNVEVNGVSSTVEELVAQYGALAESALQPQSLCVAGWLPEAFTVDQVMVRGDELVVSLSADEQVLSGEAFSTLGSCD